MVEKTAAGQRMNLEEFLEFSKDKPEIFYNAHQRLLAAIESYGKKDGRWQFIIKQENDNRNIKTRYDSSDFADEFVSFLKRAAVNNDMRNKLTVIISPPGAGKSEFLKTLSETLRVYSDSEAGAQYLLKIDLEELQNNHALDVLSKPDKSRFIEEVATELGTKGKRKLTLGENIQDEVYLLQRRYCQQSKTKIEEIIEDLSKDTKDYWKTPTINKHGVVSSTMEKITGAIVNSLSKIIKTRDGEPDYDKIQNILEKLVYVEKATNAEVINISEPVVAADDQHLDYKGIFGGKMFYRALNELGGDNSNVLSYDFGILGNQSAPSPRGNIIYISEVLKGSPSFSNSLLDFVQDMRTKVPPSFEESFDAVMIGTTNMDDYKKVADTIKPYLLRRSNIIVFRSMTKISDAEAALTEIYRSASKELDIHYPPHFLRMLARIWVEASVSHFGNISLKDKADLYNGVFLPEIKESLEDIIRDATQKPILELEEGVKLGIPYDDMIKTPSKLYYYANFSRKISVDSGYLPKEELNNKICLGTILDNTNGTKYLEDLLNTLEDLSPETKARIQPKEKGEGATVLQDAYEEISKMMKNDVAMVEYGSEKVQDLVNKYVINVFYINKTAEDKDKKIRVPMFGTVQPIDHDFVSDIEKRANLRSDIVRQSIYSIINDASIANSKKSVDELVKMLTPTIIERYPELTNAVVDKLRSSVSGTATTLDQNRIISKLIDVGYCSQCARVAYNLFTSK
jgi:predicted Ser/Thr protein kinase